MKGVFILPCENEAYIHTSWPTSVLWRKLECHHYCLKHLNGTSSKVWKCMDQQCSAIVKHIIKCFSCLPLSLTYVPSLNSHDQSFWSMTRSWPIVIQMSPKLINISYRILIDPLLYHCWDSVIYVLKSGMLGSHRSGATIEVRHFAAKLLDGCACTVRRLTLLLKLKLVPRLGLYKNI